MEMVILSCAYHASVYNTISFNQEYVHLTKNKEAKK